MTRFLACMSVTLVLLLGSALAAGPYDGTWRGVIEGASAKCPPATIGMRITGNNLSGILGLGVAKVPFKGTVAADGSVIGSYNLPTHSLSGTLTGKITGSEFAGQLDSAYAVTSSSCVRNVTAKRS